MKKVILLEYHYQYYINQYHIGLNVDLDALSAESAAAAFVSKIDLTNIMADPEARKAPRQAQWFPMLLSPPALDGTMAGDVGFDPVGFSKTKDNLNYMREAEIKHSRLAMLGVVGWSFSELYHQNLAKIFGLDNLLAAEGKAPSILNGGLTFEYVVGTAVISLLLGGLLEYLSYVAKTKPNYIPGDLGFDPLKLYSFRGSFGLDRIDIKETQEEKLQKARSDMELAEIKHGRLAMLAITAFVAQEYVSGIPVVQQTPFFFGDPIF